MKLKRRHRKIIVNVLILFGVVLSVLCVYLVLRIVLRTSTPWIAVASGSMRPALEVGDLVIVQGVPADEIKVGDIIIFDSPTKPHPTIHRVVRIEEQQGKIFFVTKGDASSLEDNPVSQDQVHGRVIYKIPFLGYLALDPAIPIILVMIIMVVMLLWPERDRRKVKLRKRHMS